MSLAKDTSILIEGVGFILLLSLRRSWQSESVICMHNHADSFHIDHYRILSRGPLTYSRSLFVICFIHSGAHMSIPDFRFALPRPLLPGNLERLSAQGEGMWLPAWIRHPFCVLEKATDTLNSVCYLYAQDSGEASNISSFSFIQGHSFEGGLNITNK